MKRDRALDNPINWSFRVGRMFDITIRVHIAFLLCAVVLVWMEMSGADGRTGPSIGRALIDALGTYALLFLIVLLHEFGHCFGARFTGGEADEILLWPLGGLASVNPPHNAGAHMITTVAGPSVNVVICAVCSAILVLWTGSLGGVPWNPLHPMLPADRSLLATVTEPQIWLMRFFGLSYFLLLVNLLPIFPFDGGRIVQAWLWPKKGYVASMEFATGTGMIAALAIGLFGLFLEQSWLLMMIAVFGYMTCWQTRRMIKEQGAYGLNEFGSEFSRGYSFGSYDESAEKKPGFLERRRLRRAARKAEAERRRRADHESEVERILGKVARTGLDSLTARERRTLEQETRHKRRAEAEQQNSPRS